MGKIPTRRWLFLVLSAMVLEAEAESLTMGVGDWCPYVCDPRSESGREGYLVDVMRAVFEPEGINIETMSVPFARNIQMNRHGLLDGIIGVYRNDMREFPWEFRFSRRPLGWGVSRWYVAATSDWRYEGIDSLRALSRIATVKAYDYGSPELDAYLEANPEQVLAVTGLHPQKRLIRLLVRGRIDAFVEDDNVVRYELHSSPEADAVQPAGVLSSPMPVYIVFSPALDEARASRYLALLSEGVDRLRQSGRLDAILARYRLNDWADREQSSKLSQ